MAKWPPAAIVYCLLPAVFLFPIDLEPKRVLVVHSYGTDFQWTRELDEGIRSVLYSDPANYRIVFTEYLHAKHHNSEEYFAETAGLFAEKYAGWHFDVIIVSDDLGFAFMQRYRDAVFGPVPTVFVGINDYEPSLTEGMANVTGVAEAVSVTETIDLAFRLFPDGSLVVLGDGTHTFRLNADLVRRDLALRETDRPIRFYPTIRVSELAALAATLRPTDAVLLISSVLEDDGTVADYWRAGGLVSTVMPTPVFSLWDFFIGTGVAGGLLVSGRDQGTAAAELATQILAGDPADSIPVITDSPNRWVFDMGALGPAGVRASDLPRGARLVNRRLMIWHAYRAAVLVASFILVSMAILISLLIMNIRKRSQVAGKLRESLLEKEVLLKEIHHRVKNNLQVVSSMLNIQSGLVRDRRSLDYFKDCESRVYSMALVHDQLYQSDTLTRIAMRDYMEDLVTTLYGVLAIPSDRLIVNPQVVDLFLDIDRAIPVGLVVNELLSNALRYAYPAGEGEVRLTIERSDDIVRIVVRDWGVGMPEGWERGETLGLNLVRALAQQISGVVDFYDAGPGLEVRVRFPAVDPA